MTATTSPRTSGEPLDTHADRSGPDPPVPRRSRLLKNDGHNQELIYRPTLH